MTIYRDREEHAIRLFWRSESAPTREQRRLLGLHPAFPRLPRDRKPVPEELARYWSATAKDSVAAEAMEQCLVSTELAPEGGVESIHSRCTEQKRIYGTIQPDPSQRQEHLRSRRHGGIDVHYAWRFAGGRGAGVRVVDLELGGRPVHPDLPHVEQWGVRRPCVHSDHPIPVLGLLCGRDSGRGVVGIVPEARVAIATARPADPLYHPFNVLRHVVSRCELPAVALVEITLSDDEGHDLPFEVFSIGRAVLRYAIEQGVHVVVAGGNGSWWLDPLLLDAYGRPKVDSGAILVGAREPRGTDRLARSNFGMRLDVSCWGDELLTCGAIRGRSSGYDPLFVEFGSTSGAAAVAAGAVASLAGIAWANGGRLLGPDAMRRLLISTGYSNVRGVGPHPDLRAAILQLREEHGDLVPATVASILPVGTHDPTSGMVQ